MKKLVVVLVAVTMLVVAASVLASSRGTACTANAHYRSIGLRVSGLTCAAAYKAATMNNAGYKCHYIGSVAKLPFTNKCVSTKHKSRFYIYKVLGG